jgi:hypothetical protein
VLADRNVANAKVRPGRTVASHHRLIHFIPESLTYSVPLFLRNDDATEPYAKGRGCQPASLLDAPRSDDGVISPGRQSHSAAAQYISLVVLHTEYTKRRPNGFNVHALGVIANRLQRVAPSPQAERVPSTLPALTVGSRSRGP